MGKTNSKRPANLSLPPSRGETALRAFHEEEEIHHVYDLRLLAKLWQFLRPQARWLLASLLAIVVLAALALSRPLVMRAGFEQAQKVGATQAIFHAGMTLTGLLISEQILSFFQSYWLQIVGARSMAALRAHVFRFLHTRRVGFFDSQPVGRLVTRVTNDVDAVGEAFGSGAINAVGDVLKLLGIVIMMLALDTKLALIAFAALPPVWFIVNYVRRGARIAYREIRAITARLNAFLSEQVAGMAVTQAYAQEHAAEVEFDGVNRTYRNANVRSIALESTLDAAVEMVASLCIAAVISYADIRPFGHVVTFGTLVAFIAYLEQFFGPIRDLSSRYTQLQSALTGAERVFLLLENRDEDAPMDASSSAPSITADSTTALELNHVTFSYKPGVPVLNDISLSVRQGERVALVGPTGSGKSTVANLFLRLYEADAGGVRVFGHDVRSMDRQRVRGLFSVVPQDVFLFPGTVSENIALNQRTPDMARVEHALTTLGILDVFRGREGGLNAVVQERGANFSAGERQLIAFARAVYRDAPILLLDEATANVDSNTEARLQEAMLRLVEGRTALIIAHRLSTIRTVNRVLVLQHGVLQEEGAHDALLARGGLYARLYEGQARQEPGVSPTKNDDKPVVWSAETGISS